MKTSLFGSSLSHFTTVSALTLSPLLFAACGGSKETNGSSTTASSETPAASNASAPAPAQEPTMQNMKTALVDAIQTISTDTVAEISNLAKKGEAIEIPESFESVQGALASTGQSDLFKGLSSSLNDSAVSALSGYKDSITKTIGSLDLPDVDTILKGGDDSLTRYLESTASGQLKENLVPYVKDAVKKADTQGWLEKIQGAIPENTGGLLGQVSAATGIKMPTNFNPESYLTDELMDKFFGVMARQEKLFRQNPKGRSAELFKKMMETDQ